MCFERITVKSVPEVKAMNEEDNIIILSVSVRIVVGESAEVCRQMQQRDKSTWSKKAPVAMAKRIEWGSL